MELTGSRENWLVTCLAVSLSIHSCTRRGIALSLIQTAAVAAAATAEAAATTAAAATWRQTGKVTIPQLATFAAYMNR